MSNQQPASGGASEPGKPNAKPRRKRRWLRRLGLTFVTIVVLLVVLYVFRQPLFGRWVADEVGDSLSEVLGVPVRVERVLGSWIADARVEQISVNTDEALGVLAGFDADALQVRFSLWELLFGDVIKGIQGVDAENLRLTLDFTRPSLGADPDVTLGDIVAAVPRRFPPIDIDAQVIAITGLGVIEVDDVAITSSGDEVLRLDALQIVLPRPAGLAGALHARIRRTDQGLEWQSDSVVAGLTLREVTAGLDNSLVAAGHAAGADFDIRLGTQDAALRTGTMQVAQVPPWVLRLLPTTMLHPSSGTLTLEMDAASLQPLRVDARLDGKEIVFPDEHINMLRARATIEPDQVTFTDTQVEARDGVLRAKNLVFDTRDAWIVRSLQQVEVSIQNVQSWIEFDHPLAIDLYAQSADAARVTIDRLKIEGAGTSLSGSGRIEVPEDLDGFEEAPFEAKLKGTLGDNTFGPFTLGGQVAFDGRAFGTILAPRIEGRVTGKDLTVNGRAVQHLDVEGSWLDPELDLQRLELRSSVADVRGSTRLQLDPLNIGASDLDFEIRDLAAVRSWIPDVELPDVKGTARGTAKLQGTWKDLRGSIELAASGLHVDEHDIGSLQLEAQALGKVIQVSTVDARGTWGELTGRATLRLADEQATIERLEGKLENHGVRLRAPLSLDYSDGVQFSGLDAEALGGTVRGSGLVKGHPRGRLAFENIDLGALHVEQLSGRATGQVTYDAFNQNARFTIEGFRLRERDTRIEVIASQQPEGGLDVTKLTVDAGPSLRFEGSGSLPFHLGPSGMEKQAIEAPTFGFTLTTDDASAWVDAPLRAVRIEARGNDKQITATVRGQRLEVVAGVAPVAAVVGSVTVTPASTALSGTIEDDARLSGTFEATSQTGWDWRTLELFDWDALALDGRVKATLHDANGMLALLPESAIAVRGKMHADLTAKGPLKSLELGGRVWPEDVAVRLYGVANFVDLTKMKARLVEKKLRVSEVAIRYQLGSTASTPEPTSRPSVAPEDELDIPEMRYVREALTAMKDVTGTLVADVSIRRENGQPRLGGFVRGRELSMPFPEYRTSASVATLDIVLEGTRAVIQPVRIEAGEGNGEVSGWIDLPLGDDERVLADMPAEVTVSAKAPDIRALGRIIPALDGVAGSVNGRVTLTNSISNPSLAGELDATNVEMPLPGWKLPLRIPKIHATADDKQVRVQGVQVFWGKARATVDGTLVPPARWLDDWKHQELDARIALDVPDLSLLEEVSEELRRVNGRITGNVHATGTLFRPRLDGAIDLENIRGSLPGALPAVDRLSGRIALQDRSIQLTNVRGQLGHSPFTISGSAQIPEEGIPSVDLRLQGQNLRLVQTRDMRMRSDMDLRVAGDVGDLTATGTVRIVDLVYVASMDLLGGGPETAGEGLDLFSFPWEPLASTKLDVRVRADDSIRIRTNVLRGNLSADVHYVGTGRAPIPRGSASANDFLVKLPFSSLKVERGELRFTEENPNSPTVDATARTEMKGIDLSVRVLGQVPDVELRTSSVPPIPESDAILLLTTGATSEELRQEGLARAALTRIGSVFGQTILSGGRGPTDPDELGFFDRFQFRQGRRVSRTGQETIEVEFETSDRLFLRAEQDRYDDFNAGLVWRWRFK